MVIKSFIGKLKDLVNLAKVESYPYNLSNWFNYSWKHGFVKEGCYIKKNLIDKDNSITILLNGVEIILKEDGTYILNDPK